MEKYELLIIGIIYLFCLLAFLWATFNYYTIIKVDVKQDQSKENEQLLQETDTHKLIDIGDKIAKGANTFLKQEYAIMSVFIIIFSVVVLVGVDLINPEK